MSKSDQDDPSPIIHKLVTVSSDFAKTRPNQVQELSKHQLIYSICGLILGLVCIIGGIVLFMSGIIGSTSWTANIFGASSKISDAAPGAVLFIVGLFIVLLTRYSFRVTK